MHCGVAMQEPENNKIALNALVENSELYTQVNCVVYDRCCSITSRGEREAGVEENPLLVCGQVPWSWTCRWLPVQSTLDWSSQEVTQGCEHEHLGADLCVVQRILNTFNTMNAETHRFMVLVYARHHNMMVLNSDTEIHMLARRQ